MKGIKYELNKLNNSPNLIVFSSRVRVYLLPTTKRLNGNELDTNRNIVWEIIKSVRDKLIIIWWLYLSISKVT